MRPGPISPCLQRSSLLALLLLAACASSPAPDAKGSRKVPPAADPIRSTLQLEDLRELQQSLLFEETDVRALRRSHEVLAPQVDAILDVWYGFVAATPHLVASFLDLRTGAPDPDYLAAVRVRFGQWILDTAAAQYDQRWLDRQLEIGRRHHTTGKNRTDGVESTPIVPLRHLLALVYPITATLKPFLAKGGAPPEEVERMHQAWTKSVLMQAILWAQPYVRDGEF